MFNGFNRYQKLAVVICFLVFITANLFAVFILIQKKASQYNNQDIEPINLIVSNNDTIINTTYKFGEELKIDEGYFKITIESNTIIGKAPVSLNIYEDLINVNLGTVLILNKSSLKIPYSTTNISLSENGIFIYNSELKELINLSKDSTAKVDGNEISQNETFELKSVTNPQKSDFNRTRLTDYEGYRDLAIATSVFNQDVLELTDIIPPRLIKITPETGYETSSSKIRIIGITEDNSIVWVEGKKVEIDGMGNFANDVNLVEGENKINLVLVDKYGNSSEIILLYNRL